MAENMDVVHSIELVAMRIARTEKFDSNPVALYNEVIVTFGTDHGNVIWKRACQIYDEIHAED